MTSFELKPLTHVGIGTDVDQIAWTCPRDGVPVLLVGRVSASQWAATFDGVKARYDYIFDNFDWWMLIPCFLCFSMPRMIQISRDNQKGWLRLAQEQAEIYRSAGIQVTLAREISGGGGDSNVRNEIVGLKFDIAPNNGGAAFVVPQTMSRMDGGDDNFVAKLEKLDQMHAAGSLSDSEYAAAKEKLLR
mmetsp:Transcript_40475/g.47372  ORF Transcript_40475/g.47372 Transcript_40475/m.47372 type:complete len:189 (+) Transcript_40475:43-609(+)|eukprot:CAMPEP_0194379904 /NCGR_PEP_ID=MMETSP0174-20130528/41284_1 /TAXON_ID=216777 /ORGANISM="Proboscia alata, Strain PI-D3" /LENGTH=188 /DNA_ID=CAMNT_0039162935 /DNA_START=35 /DNA_END=601 /DNA_ORIENTATION=+